MKIYTGVKVIKAEPMDRIEAQMRIGRMVDGLFAMPGYLVEFSDGKLDWRPKKQFEDNYRQCAGMPFSVALEAMKRGKRVRRAEWEEDLPTIFIKEDEWGPFMNADLTDEDLLAEDWEILV